MNGRHNARKRLLYAAAFAVLLGVEVMIALFVHDRFVRPYLGDVLAVVTVYCGARIVFVNKPRFLSVWVTALAFVVELLQLTDISEHVGRVLAVILGSTFDVKDLLCYAIGGIIAAAWDILKYRIGEKNSDIKPTH